MKLSGHIRNGAQQHPQGFHHMFRDGATCALGAAAVSKGLDPLDVDFALIEDTFPELHMPLTSTPKGVTHSGLLGSALSTAIVYLNDTMKWSREEIADWVESLGY